MRAGVLEGSGLTSPGFISSRLTEPNRSTEKASIVAEALDWLATVAVNHPASVAIAAAVEEHALNERRPTVVASVRRGVDIRRVEEAFAQCQRDFVEKILEKNEQGRSAKPEQVNAELIIQWQPVRIRRGMVCCTLDTNDKAEYRYAFAAAFRTLAEQAPQLRDQLLRQRIGEIAAAYADVRDSLEELLWRNQN